MDQDHSLAAVTRWVGRSYAEMSCYALVCRAFFEYRGVALPSDYYAALPYFRVVREPQAWDVVVIRNHPIVANHCGLMLDSVSFVHSMEGSGVTIGRTDRSPISDRIAGYLRLKG